MASASTREFQSTLPVRGATDYLPTDDKYIGFQSTLPVRGATVRVRVLGVVNGISIHAPRAGSDRRHMVLRRSRTYFNPRSPCGERPKPPIRKAENKIFQSTLPVRGATSWETIARRLHYISIHAPRAGSDTMTIADAAPILDFNPRSPCGERPRQATTGRMSAHFNPRSPCGERLTIADRNTVTGEFQSTLPVRGAT